MITDDIIEQYKNCDNIENIELITIQNKLMEYLLKREMNLATEYLVNIIKENEYLYTIRDDEKSEIWIYKDGIYKPQGKTYIKEICRKYLGNVFKINILNNVISKIESDTFVEPNKFFKINYVNLIAVKNGILNIKTKELQPFTPKKIFFNKIPVVFDETKKCNKIIHFFNDVLKNDGDIESMQELFGFLLQKEYTVETAFMFSGSGRNGKSKTLDIIKRFIGIYNCTNRTIIDIERDQFARGDLINKLANICGDISSEMITNAGWFKALTGRDIISAPRKFKTTIEFENYAKMIFSANTLPIVTDNSMGFWERWKIWEFPYFFGTKEEIEQKCDEDKILCKLIDPNIIQKITTESEMSGLLNWSLLGLDRLLKQKRFSGSKTGDDIKKMWTRKSNSFKAFLMDHSIKADFEDFISKNELRFQYSIYCRKYKLKSVSDKSIKYILNENGVGDGREYIEDRQEYVWYGIKLDKNIDNNEDNLSQVSQGSQGISESIGKVKNPFKVKHHDFLDLVDTDSVLISHKNEKTLKNHAFLNYSLIFNVISLILETKKTAHIFEINDKIKREFSDYLLTNNDINKSLETLKKEGKIFEIKPSEYKLV